MGDLNSKDAKAQSVENIEHPTSDFEQRNIQRDAHCDRDLNEFLKPDATCPVAEAVAKQVLSRAEKGFRKYGTNCARTDLSIADWVEHLQQELMDAAVYVERLKMEVAALQKYKERMEWLHDCSGGSVDPEGCEWGIYRVKFKEGKAVEVLQTLSDFSDLDAEMEREKLAEPEI